MSNVEQMEDNLSYMKDFAGLNAQERETIRKAQEALSRYPIVPCTACNYCAKVCPMNIGISGTFIASNILTLYNDMAKASHEEGWQVKGHGKARANECIKCGACEEVCPQHIEIRKELEKASQMFKM